MVRQSGCKTIKFDGGVAVGEDHAEAFFKGLAGAHGQLEIEFNDDANGEDLNRKLSTLYDQEWSTSWNGRLFTVAPAKAPPASECNDVSPEECELLASLQAATPHQIKVVQGSLSDPNYKVRGKAGKTLAKLGVGAEDAAAECIPQADWRAKFGWLIGLEELGPEAARFRVPPGVTQGLSAAGWRASRLVGELTGELIGWLAS